MLDWTMTRTRYLRQLVLIRSKKIRYTSSKKKSINYRTMLCNDKAIQSKELLEFRCYPNRKRKGFMFSHA